MSRNAFGLERRIPTAVEREVRQRCKFCCVICCEGICEFHHFAPQFAEAKQHIPDGITLLCPTCHTYAEKGLISLDQIVIANDKRRLSIPESKISLSLSNPFYFIIGSMIFIGSGRLLTVRGETILDIHSCDNNFPVITGTFYNSSGDLTLVIEENILRIGSTNWDASFKGKNLKIWSKSGEIALDIVFYLPFGIHIRTINMRVRDWTFKTNMFGSISIQNTVGGGGIINSNGIVSQGPLELNEGMFLGPTCINMGFDTKRFDTLVSSFRIEELISEISSYEKSKGGMVKIQLTRKV